MAAAPEGEGRGTSGLSSGTPRAQAARRQPLQSSDAAFDRPSKQARKCRAIRGAGPANDVVSPRRPSYPNAGVGMSRRPQATSRNELKRKKGCVRVTHGRGATPPAAQAAPFAATQLLAAASVRRAARHSAIAVLMSLR
jgi:hypothetical protein